jgi:hypothetical protein
MAIRLLLLAAAAVLGVPLPYCLALLYLMIYLKLCGAWPHWLK